MAFPLWERESDGPEITNASLSLSLSWQPQSTRIVFHLIRRPHCEAIFCLDSVERKNKSRVGFLVFPPFMLFLFFFRFFLKTSRGCCRLRRAFFQNARVTKSRSFFFCHDFVFPLSFLCIRVVVGTLSLSVFFDSTDKHRKAAISFTLTQRDLVGHQVLIIQFLKLFCLSLVSVEIYVWPNELLKKGSLLFSNWRVMKSTGTVEPIYTKV